MGQQRPKPRLRHFQQFLRRAHLYLGLFLLPWALLYGLTGFLFNHPGVFADRVTVYFDSDDLTGTELEHLVPVETTTNSIVRVLTAQNESGVAWTRGNQAARYTGRDTFVATVKAAQRTYSFVFDPVTKSGLIRETRPNPTASAPAPFSTEVFLGSSDGPTEPKNAALSGSNPLAAVETIAEQIQRAAPEICERKGITGAVANCTNGPEIQFSMLVDEEEWAAKFNPVTKQLSGERGTPASDISWRTFLLRMHLSHRYPGAFNIKWLWAVGVDAIALTLCFWGLSGLVMWWQIKGTRRAGTVVLAVSVALATWLGLNMHSVLAV